MTSATATESPYKVIYVLGGPGAGKGTQCSRLVKKYKLAHISAGDCLREEQSREGSKYGDLIRTYIKEGQIVPKEITIKLLEQKMKDYSAEGIDTFLIDGFPRKLDQYQAFEEMVCPALTTLFFQCGQETMLARLLNRGKTSGREDDNTESIKKRFVTYVETSMPVIDAMKERGRCVTINAENDPDTVFEDTCAAMNKALGL
ncbi:uridylate kinase [Schizosaccharomyces japonicus yFS275]|uniref:Uridylate kinase n=1 Tax=Schizosaccharomyces japonicus (strain yFS275 / FY16936) TaxID=402676 RepID=B6JWK2_SCHJY|nr:uridylate kinase [Schizosaccharomyces japonicus yFS275]EEB05753.2 uridylate kinase [Schizosaccharomyces japonicus yFS275]